jgi:hypothetical protein
MANADRGKSDALDAARVQDRRTIPMDPSGRRYADDLDQYLDQLLDVGLDQAFPASDSLDVPTRRDVEKK